MPNDDLDKWKKPGEKCDAFAKVMGVPNDPEHPDYIEALKKTSFPYQGGLYDIKPAYEDEPEQS